MPHPERGDSARDCHTFRRGRSEVSHRHADYTSDGSTLSGLIVRQDDSRRVARLKSADSQ